MEPGEAGEHADPRGPFKDADRLRTRLAEAAREVFESTPVFLAYAHGSRICGSPTPASDLDVGYYLEDHASGASLPVREEMVLADRLSEAAEVDVDLRNLAHAPLELRGRVLETGIRIYSSDEVRRVGLERDLLGRYHDYKETFRRMHDERLRGFADSGL